MSKPYQVVGLGGTFDHFHKGHQHFLDFASRLGLHIHVGLTTKSLIQHKPYSHLIETYYDRKVNVKKYCGDNHISCHVSELIDVYGPTLENSKIEALAVTTETISGADKINEMRQHLKLPELPVHICSMLKDESGQQLHADRIRAGKVSREGRVYELLFTQDIQLSEQQRHFFGQLQGEIVQQPSTHHISPHDQIIVVGDMSVEKFITNNWRYTTAIFDKKEQRQQISSATISQLQVDRIATNMPGHISKDLIRTLKEKPRHLLVEGEEDLATVALVLLSPLQTHIYYGQPHQGLVEMVVTEELKEKFYQQLQ